MTQDTLTAQLKTVHKHLVMLLLLLSDAITELHQLDHTIRSLTCDRDDSDEAAPTRH